MKPSNAIGERMVAGSKEAVRASVDAQATELRQLVADRAADSIVAFSEGDVVRWLSSLRDAVVALEQSRATAGVRSDVAQAMFDDCRQLDQIRRDIALPGALWDANYCAKAFPVGHILGRMLCRLTIMDQSRSFGAILAHLLQMPVDELTVLHGLATTGKPAERPCDCGCTTVVAEPSGIDFADFNHISHISSSHVCPICCSRWHARFTPSTCFLIEFGPDLLSTIVQLRREWAEKREAEVTGRMASPSAAGAQHVEMLRARRCTVSVEEAPEEEPGL